MTIQFFLSNLVLLDHSNHVLKQLVCNRELILKQLVFGSHLFQSHGLLRLKLIHISDSRIGCLEVVRALLVEDRRLLSNCYCAF